jgi:cytochrome oxidase Cu insertion factor (SCO1/SenC/PrrC family)
MTSRRKLVLAACLTLAGARASAHVPDASPAPLSNLLDWFSRPRPAAPAYFGDHLLRDHHGRALRFYADLLQGRTVLLNAVATRCTGGFCLPKTLRLAEARALLGPRFGSEIFFVTLTTDPERDTVDRLKTYAEALQVDDPGWRFVTGDRAPLGSALQQLGYSLAGMHTQVGELVLGNTRVDRWRRLRGDATPRAVADALLELSRAHAG